MVRKNFGGNMKLLINIKSFDFIFAQEENLKVLDRWIEWSNAENMLTLFLNQQAYRYLDIRESEVALLKTTKSGKRNTYEDRRTFS